MRGSKAKKLRRIARRACVGMPLASYDVSWHGRKFRHPYTGDVHAYEVPLLRLSQNCERYYYKQLKGAGR